MAHVLDTALQFSQVKTGIITEQDEYLPLALYHLTVQRELSFTVYLKARVPPSTDFQYLPLCAAGESVQKEWLRKLQEKNFPWVYFRRAEMTQVLQYIHQDLHHILKKDDVSTKQKFSRVYDTTMLWVRHFFTDEEAVYGESIKYGLDLTDSLYDCLGAGDYHRDWLVELCRHEQRLFLHCLNACLLGMAFVRYLRWPKIRIRAFALGVLLHDIGLTDISGDIMYRAGPLTADEWLEVKKHPSRSVRLLKECPQIWREALLMIQQHHENGDGSGYASGLKLDDIHSWAQILRIIDSYEAMTSDRGWRKKYSPVEALTIMREGCEKGKVYNSQYLANFIKFLSTPAAKS
jgi:HD-GYP domain-containing protein (c-di-GMP phosphodiesterase class II)